MVSRQKLNAENYLIAFELLRHIWIRWKHQNKILYDDKIGLTRPQQVVANQVANKVAHQYAQIKLPP